MRESNAHSPLTETTNSPQSAVYALSEVIEGEIVNDPPRRQWWVLVVGCLVIIGLLLVWLASPTPKPENIQLFRDEDSITLYVPAGRSINLAEWSWGRTGTGLVALSGYSAFAESVRTGPVCFRLEYQNAGETADPDICPDQTTGHYYVSTTTASGMFWYDVRNQRPYEIQVSFQNGEPTVCAADAQQCTVPID